MLTHYFSDPVMLDLIQHTPAFPYLNCLSAELVATGSAPIVMRSARRCQTSIFLLCAVPLR